MKFQLVFHGGRCDGSTSRDIASAMSRWILHGCDAEGSPFTALARHVIQLAGVEFEI